MYDDDEVAFALSGRRVARALLFVEIMVGGGGPLEGSGLNRRETMDGPRDIYSWEWLPYGAFPCDGDDLMPGLCELFDIGESAN